ncbi:MAG TPA: hypothetical protein V6C65_23655 [Allocoleopsis sp.]
MSIFVLATVEAPSQALKVAESSDKEVAAAELRSWADENGWVIAQYDDDRDATAFIAELEPAYTAQNANPNPIWIDIDFPPEEGVRKLRKYQCQIRDCGAIVKIVGNHNGNIYSLCPACSWRGGFDRHGTCYTALAHDKDRPMKYVGDAE